MQLEEQDTVLVRQALLNLENQYRKQAEKLHEEMEMLAHMTGAERTTKIRSEDEAIAQIMKRIAKVRALF